MNDTINAHIEIEQTVSRLVEEALSAFRTLEGQILHTHKGRFGYRTSNQKRALELATTCYERLCTAEAAGKVLPSFNTSYVDQARRWGETFLEAVQQNDGAVSSKASTFSKPRVSIHKFRYERFKEVLELCHAHHRLDLLKGQLTEQTRERLLVMCELLELEPPAELALLGPGGETKS